MVRGEKILAANLCDYALTMQQKIDWNFWDHFKSKDHQITKSWRRITWGERREDRRRPRSWSCWSPPMEVDEWMTIARCRRRSTAIWKYEFELRALFSTRFKINTLYVRYLTVLPLSNQTNVCSNGILFLLQQLSKYSDLFTKQVYYEEFDRRGKWRYVVGLVFWYLEIIYRLGNAKFESTHPRSHIQKLNLVLGIQVLYVPLPVRTY